MTFLKDPFGFTKEQRNGWLEQISTLNKTKLFNDAMQYAIFYNDPRPGWGGMDRLEVLRTVLLMNVPTLQAVEKELSKVKGDRPEMVQLLQCYLNDYEKLIAGIDENQKSYSSAWKAEQSQQLDFHQMNRHKRYNGVLKLLRVAVCSDAQHQLVPLAVDLQVLQNI